MPRRTPSQARSRDKVDLILEAATRILDERGRAGLTTNSIAARAGVSVGTLYEYFPNKEAVLVALARRLLERDQSVMLGAIAGPPGEPFSERARRAVRALVSLHAETEKVRRVVMEVHLAKGHVDEHAAPVRQVALELGRPQGETAALPLSPVALFVLTRAVVGVIRAALREDPALLRSRELEDELVSLVERYARLRKATSPASRRLARFYNTAADRAGTLLAMRAEGKFSIKAFPEPPYDDADGVALGRFRFEKTFEGPLSATSTVHMLSARNLPAQSGAYVASERIRGELDGKAGSFVVVHLGLMDRGQQSLQISIVPDSGTGQLAGIRGTMGIGNDGGQHHYTIDYTLPTG